MSKFLIIAVLVSYLLGLGLGLVGPEKSRLKTLRERAATEEQIISKRKERLASLEGMEGEVEKYGEELEKVEVGLPKNMEISYLYELIQDTVYKEGIILKKVGSPSVTIKEKAGKREVREARVSLEIKSSYEDFLNFLGRLESSGRLIEVEQISFKTPDEESGSTLYDFDLVLKVHSLSFDNPE